MRTLVAFSGEVNDPESGPDPFTENSPSLNPTLKGRDMREAFKDDEFQILLVANKFQTGFDQPLLCAMYVDKRLAGIQAVQTLSRLNRCYPGKDTTYVLDFVNDTQEVLDAFKTYYDTAELADVTDPNIVFNLRAKLDASGHYDDFEVDRVVGVEILSGGNSILTVSEKGFGKRTDVAEYRLQTRGGKGIINLKTTPRVGFVTVVLQVCNNEDVMLISNTGNIIRLNVEDISLLHRSTQGVKLINLESEERLVGLARAERGEEPSGEENDVALDEAEQVDENNDAETTEDGDDGN